jgi:hypothetical protein
MLDEVLPFGASTITTFFARQFRKLRANAGSVQTARAVRSSAHSRMVFCFVQFFLQSNPLKKSLHTMKPLYPL